VLGLDPDPAKLWPEAIDAAPAEGAPAERAAAAIEAQCAALIAAAAPACVAAKPQVACFERLGAPGWAVLARTIAQAQDAGLLVIADAKRGDIDVTARAYGQAFFGGTPTPFGHVVGLGVDALTVNPYLGADAIAPLAEAARATGGGLFVLVRTSNPGAGDLQDRRLDAGGTVAEQMARLVDELGERETPLADIGAVTGATVPQQLVRLRELMPHAPFLLPGIGAQGGRVEDVAPAFAPGPAGGLVTASRSIATAHETSGGSPAAAARAEAERLRETAWSLI
jgi:orotidine-5'-phosphate decarboxylase